MTVADDLKGFLGQDRGGAKLGAGLVEVVVSYLVDVVKVKDVNEVTLANLKDSIDEAWANENDGQSLPKMHSRVVTSWLRGGAGIGISSARSADGGDELADDCDETVLFGVSEPSMRDVELLEKDKTAQGLSGTRILILSAAIELGRVPAAGEVLGKIGFKSDPRLSEMAKQQRKAGMVTLSKILDSSTGSVRRELQSHFGGLIRDFTEARFIVEASLISQWWSETQTVSGDDAVLVLYIKEWLRKYPGRGIPETLDVLLATRVSGTKAASGATSAELKELKDAVKSAKSEIGELKSELKRMKQSIRDSAGREGDRTDAGKGKGKGPTCHFCGERGHIAKNCPNKSKDDEADDKEE